MSRDEGGSSRGGALRALGFLIASLGSGAALTAALYQLLDGYQSRIEAAKQPEDTVMVMVASRDLYPGVAISEEDLYAVEIAPRYLPEGVYLSPEHLLGRVPRERVLANELVRADRLSDPESGIGLNAVIPRAMRAISINISDAQALAGSLTPGSYVDVLYTGTDAATPDGRTLTTTLVQAVFVLGVDSRMQRETREEARTKRTSGSPSVTMLVTTTQAEELAKASASGALTLSLRNDRDVDELASIRGVDLDTLRGHLAGPTRIEEIRTLPHARPPAPSSVAPPETSIKIIEGEGSRLERFDASGDRVK